MSNRIYAKRRNPDWLIQFARWIGRKRWLLSQDWACTKLHFKNAKDAFATKAVRLINEHYMTVAICFTAALFLTAGLVALNYFELWLRLR